MPAPRLESELAAFGAFFAVVILDDDDEPPTPPWRPLSELVTDAGVLRARVLAVRDVLARSSGRGAAGVELRVAASTAHLGLIARLVAPLVAAAALGSEHVDPRIGPLWWEDRLGAPFPLAVRTVTAPANTPARLSGTALEALTEAVAREFAVSPRVLWGNVGSATNTAARLVGEARPDLASRAHETADALLADRRVDGGGLHSGPLFRRRSCCLVYRLAGDTSAMCGDCVLTR